jgi:hypothetical protein
MTPRPARPSVDLEPSSATVSDAEEQRAEVRQTLDGMLRERAGQDGRAVISNPINIGIGTKA